MSINKNVINKKVQHKSVSHINKNVIGFCLLELFY